MFATTHIAMGFYIYLMFERLAPIESKIILLILLVIGSILPDIDYGGSLLGRYFKIVGEVFRHRGFTHTIFGIIIFSLLVHAIWADWVYTLGFSIAYIMHLFLDAMTKAGIKPFWFGPKLRGFTKTNSFVDKFLLVFILFVCVLMVFDVI